MIKELTLTRLDEITDKESKLVLFNDDVNTFDWVIQSLISVCDHTAEQAEQCAVLVHFKGKYPVKLGPKDDLIPRCSALLDRGLNAEVQ
ncbi:MAG: ATP-dependent Clp protease adaptor ClpS [Bacteroidia bacterium]|nr:ATP-dependent Clp protease adaptor ClpS [Bacteroidia bacterium]